MYNRLYESELLRDQVKELEMALPPNQEFVQSEYWFKKRDTTNLRIPLNADFSKWKRKLFKNKTGWSCSACYKGKLQSQVVPNHYDTVKTLTTFMPMTLN